MSLLFVIPFYQENAEQAENLVDWIYWLNDKKPKGQALILADFDVHAEMRERLKISAELAFESCDHQRFTSRLGDGNKINQTFRRAAEYIKGAYRCPFFWLEPDSVPVLKGWQKVISSAYEGQIKRYCSGVVTVEESRHLSRHGAYPPNAIDDVAKWLDDKKNFNVVSGEGLIWRSSPMNLVQELDTGITIYNPQTAIIHGDKDGLFLKSVKESHAKQ